jgi:putative membrane protein
MLNLIDYAVSDYSESVSTFHDNYSQIHDILICLLFFHKNSFERIAVMAEGSLNQSMDKAVKHYSALFKLPSYKRMVLLLASLCIGGGLTSTFMLFPSLEGLFNGLFLGVSLFLINLTLDHIVSTLVLKRDPIYDLRRTVGLSLFSWVFWLFFVFVGVAVARLLDLSWWVRLCLLGFSAVLTLRLTVLVATSSVSYKKLLIAALAQPFSCVVPFLVFWVSLEYRITFSVAIFLFVSLVIGFFSSFLFVFLLNRVGEQMLRVPSLSLFRAFLINWITDLNAPFEEFLERLGESHDIEVSLIKFGSQRPKAFMIVPSVHPGPFKNIGSSLLPSMLKAALEKELNCNVCVPHGLLGHEFDAASQLQNQKIINHVVESANFKVLEAKATPLIKVSNGLATACCQIFGNFAFLSLSLAPKTTEDLPQELCFFVRQEAEKRGLTCCIVVNSHNSIDGKPNMQEALDALKDVAVTCLDKAVSLKQLSFQFGAATVIPKEFSLKDGMGPGGITVMVAKVSEQKTAYVVIDSNNMVTGLREKILSALLSLGISEGEVFTTDTHSVNAVVLNQRGYHPVGEVIDHESLIRYIKKATLSAISDLEDVRAACRSIMVPDVKVIGEKLLETLCLLIDKSLQRAKKIAVPIFATNGLLLMLILMFV